MKKIILGTTICVAVAFGADTAVCKGCHGADLKTINIMGTTSQDITVMSKADFIAAMEGYKAGTYGGTKKALMKGQANMVKDSAAFADALGLK